MKIAKKLIQIFSLIGLGFILLKIIYIISLVMLKYPDPQTGHGYISGFVHDMKYYLLFLLIVIFSQRRKLIFTFIFFILSYLFLLIIFDKFNVLVEYQKWVSRGTPEWGTLACYQMNAQGTSQTSPRPHLIDKQIDQNHFQPQEDQSN